MDRIFATEAENRALTGRSAQIKPPWTADFSSARAR
jgi:hypothetical protein